MDKESRSDVTASKRIEDLMVHAERLKARRHQGEDCDRVIENLERENEALREKLGKALLLLSVYKNRSEQQLKEVQKIDVVPEPPTESKRSLLSRYLEIGQQCSPPSSKEGVSKMWRDRLLKHKSKSPVKKLSGKEDPNRDELDLARQLNSGDVKLSQKPPQEDVEEISFLLSRRL